MRLIVLVSFGSGGVANFLPGHLPQRLPLAHQRLGRVQRSDTGDCRRGGLGEPEGVAQKVQARLGSLSSHARLSRFTRQSQPPSSCLNEPRSPLALIPRQHHKSSAYRTSLALAHWGRPVGAVETLVEPVQVDVRQQRRNHAALRCAPVVALRWACLRPSFHHGRRSQSVSGAASERPPLASAARQQLVVWDRNGSSLRSASYTRSIRPSDVLGFP